MKCVLAVILSVSTMFASTPIAGGAKAKTSETHTIVEKMV